MVSPLVALDSDDKSNTLLRNLVRFYPSTGRNIPERFNFHRYRCENRKSRTFHATHYFQGSSAVITNERRPFQ
jgi:hypothetical protein